MSERSERRKGISSQHVVFGTGAIGLATYEGPCTAAAKAHLHASGRVEVAMGRASDYLGQPHRARRPGPAVHIHVHSRRRRGAGRSWRTSGRARVGTASTQRTATRTTRELVTVIYQLAGHPAAMVKQVSPTLVRMASLANRTLRELLEMRYQFEEPFIVDSTKIATRLGARANPLEQTPTQTLATYR